MIQPVSQLERFVGRLPSRRATPAVGARPSPAPRPMPEPLLERVPYRAQDEACQCDEEKKKPKKKKQPRQICYSGTFRERSKSLTKVKRKVIPCQ